MIFYQKMNSSIPYNVNVVEYEDYNYIPHLHRDFELIYVKEGELLLYTEDERSVLSEGEFGLVLQNEVHLFESPSHSRIWVMVFSEDYVRDFCEMIKSRAVNSRKLKFSENDMNFLLEHLIFGEKEKLSLTACLNFICGEFYKSNTEDSSKKKEEKTKKSTVHEILAYISEHYTEEIRLSELSAALGYEEHYLSRLFNSTFGKSFTALVNEYRIYHARRMISDLKNKTLAEIALSSGFGSVRNFNRAYKIVTGKSPKDDREN